MRGLLSLFLLAANMAVGVDSVNNTSNKPRSVWNLKVQSTLYRMW